MTKICLRNMPMDTYGDLPKVGEKAPYFVLTKNDMMPIDLDSYANKTILINVFPSIDTKMCFSSLQKCVAMLENANKSDFEIISVSVDLPYAIARNQINTDIANLTILSDFRDHRFGLDYGVLISNGPLTGILARSLFVIDKQGFLRYAEISKELDTFCHYEQALKHIP